MVLEQLDIHMLKKKKNEPGHRLYAHHENLLRTDHRLKSKMQAYKALRQ